MLPATVSASVERRLAGRIERVEPLGGGCIANATRVETDRGVLFLKWVGAREFEMLRAEAAGLAALAEPAADLVIPEIIALIDPQDAGVGVLVLSWIETGPADGSFWTRFGRAIAQLHRGAGLSYGFRESNFIGRLPQLNRPTETWPDFFRTMRLLPQVERARSSGLWARVWNEPFDRLLAQLDELLPAKPVPSLLHGDLWSGNFMVTTDGPAALIDPAVYYGHRETDLALTELFGGFSRTFYEAYAEAWPLESGYAERREIYNLYHLINHLNHFGASYASSIEHVLARFR